MEYIEIKYFSREDNIIKKNYLVNILIYRLIRVG